MIESFTPNENHQVEFNIIPKLNSVNQISLSSGDTLVAKIDSEIWDLNSAQQFYQLLTEAFPKNNVLIIFNGIELEVIKNET